MEQDLDQRRYETYAELLDYCYKAASVIGLICVEIFGYDRSRAGLAREAAIDMGRALQLTNILRDVREDAARDRIYLAQEDLRRHGYGDADVLANRYNDEFRALMADYAARARALYDSGLRLIPLLDGPRSRMCCNGLQGVYRSILAEIVKRDYDVYQRPRQPLQSGAGAAPVPALDRRRDAAAAAPLSQRVVVVGGGLAGLTCALDLAEAGLPTTLVERRPFVGGKTFSFTDPGSGAELDNGQHVFLRCCTAYIALIERLGLQDAIQLQPRLRVPVLDPQTGRDGGDRIAARSAARAAESGLGRCCASRTCAVASGWRWGARRCPCCACPTPRAGAWTIAASAIGCARTGSRSG